MKKKILANALTDREQEVLNYQINIDNYTLAILHIDSMSAEDKNELSEFRDVLSQMLAAEKREQKKAQVMLDVIKSQLEA